MTTPPPPTITVSCRNPNCIDNGKINTITLPVTQLGQNMMTTDFTAPIFCASCGWEARREASALAKDDSKATPAESRDPETPEGAPLFKPE